MPKKITRWLKVRHWIEYIIGRPLVTGMHYIPLPVAYHLGRWIGWCAWKLAKKRRTIVAQNLKIVNDHLNKNAYKEVARACPQAAPTPHEEVAPFRQAQDSKQACPQAAPTLSLDQQVREVFLRSSANIACSFCFARMKPEKFKKHIKMEGLEHFKTALSQGKGVLILLAHMGPWEVLPYLPYLFESTTKLGAMYRPMNNPHFDNWFKSVREQRGTRLFSHKDGFHKPVDFLRKGGVIGVLADQKMRQGATAPFFGKDAHTSPLPGLFQRRSGAPTLSFSIETTAPQQWTIKTFPVDYSTTQEKRTRETEAQTTNQAIETTLSQSPLDGFWLRDRF